MSMATDHFLPISSNNFIWNRAGQERFRTLTSAYYVRFSSEDISLLDFEAKSATNIRRTD